MQYKKWILEPFWSSPAAAILGLNYEWELNWAEHKLKKII